MTTTATAPRETASAQPPQARPIVVLIHRKAGNWTIEPADKESNEQRFDNHEASADGTSTFNSRWDSRHGKNADEPRPHTPIFFVEGDVFEFRCEGELPFGIGATKNPDVQALPGAPDDPFESSENDKPGPDGIRISAGGPLTAKVKTSDGRVPGVRAQRFYKFHGWVLVNGEFKPVDPDGYCGG